MHIYLMRHGQAENPAIDPEQGLTEEGRHAIQQIAETLAKKPVHVSQVFHSTKKRAQQTADIVAGIISPGISPQTMDNLKPGDNPADILVTLNQWTDDTLIVSHLPFIPSLLDLLTQAKNSIHFHTGTVACLSRSGMQWQLEWVYSQ